MLEESGLQFEQVTLRRDNGELKSPEYLAISPAGVVPALVDRDSKVALFESAAILIYLAEKSGKFLPFDQPQRGETFKWLMFELASVSAVCENIYQLTYVADPGKWMSIQIKKMRAAASILAAQLEGKDYVCGQCSIVDFALLPWMLMFEDLTEIPLVEYPALTRWRDIMRARPATASVLAG